MPSIRELYHVEVDGADWPAHLPDDEKVVLTALVKERIARSQPIAMFDLYSAISRVDDPRVPTFNRAALLDWRYGVIERAARACGAERKWTIAT